MLPRAENCEGAPIGGHPDFQPIVEAAKNPSKIKCREEQPIGYARGIVGLGIAVLVTAGVGVVERKSKIKNSVGRFTAVFELALVGESCSERAGSSLMKLKGEP